MANRMVHEKMQVINNYIDESRVPIHVVPLAERLGINVYRAPWPDNVSGKIQKDAQRGGHSGFAIFVNQGHHSNRRRFTIAHEIAHFTLHEDRIGDGIFDDALYRSGLSNAEEVQANKLAADILMPWALLNSYITNYGADADRLAREFQVSSQSMRIRLGLPV